MDAYRIAVEGTLRQTAWSYLRLRGGGGGDSAPLLSELYDRLIADGSAAARVMAEAIRPEIRNASAHEDYYWDADGRRIVSGETSLTIPEVSGATAMASAAVTGFEAAGWLVRDAVPELDQSINELIDATGAPDWNLTIRLAFARNGIPVWDTQASESAAAIVIDDVEGRRALYRVMTGVLSASLDVPTLQTLKVSTRNGCHFVVSHRALDSVRELVSADGETQRIDANVLLPILADMHLQRSDPTTTRREVTRQAIRSVIVGALNERAAIGRAEPDAAIRFNSALRLAKSALVACWGIVGEPDDATDVLAELVAASDYALAVAMGQPFSFGPLRRSVDRLVRRYAAANESNVLWTYETDFLGRSGRPHCSSRCSHLAQGVIRDLSA